MEVAGVANAYRQSGKARGEDVEEFEGFKEFEVGKGGKDDKGAE